MSLNISKARVTVTIEMDYLDSHYTIRDHNHIKKFFAEIQSLQERYEALVENPEDPRFKPIPLSVIKCEYLSHDVWTKNN